MSFADAQQRVDAWISQYEEGYFHPLTNLARLTEEVGELAREVNHRFGQKTKKWDEAEGDLAMEMADILFVLICMANREGIDLQAEFDRMMTKVETRDRDRWTKKGGRADRRAGGKADRRSSGQADRRSVDQADGWADDR
jgi:NTP pyrophosphatase (non-canonical NTP hydrolase)